MAKFDFKGSAIDFSRSSYEETGAAINAIDNIYSYAITKNTSSKVSFWGYLYSGQRYSVSLNLSKRSNYSFTAKKLRLNLYSGNTLIENYTLKGSVKFNGTGITGGKITKETYSINNDSGSYEASYKGSYNILKVSRYTDNNNYGGLHAYITRGNDIFNGTNYQDNIEAGEGNDIVNGKNGSDTIYGQNGNDKLNGQNGNDTLIGGNDNDILNGGTGNDDLVGGSGIDTAVFSSRNNTINLETNIRQNTGDGQDVLTGIENVNGGGGHDIITGNNSANKLNGGSGNDTLYGGLGDDRLVGGTGRDTAVFSSSDNLINLNTKKRQTTGDGRDILTGIENVNAGGGNDIVTGSKGRNVLNGEAGDDVLYGGLGNDTLTGGSGDDIFKIKKGRGKALITDYTSGEDSIELLGGLTESDLTITYANGDTKIRYGKDLMAIVQNTIADDITFS